MNVKADGTVGFKLSVISVVTMLYASSAVSPALGSISQAFPDASPELIKQISTIPALMTVIFALLGGYVAKFFTRRQMVFATGLILLISGTAPAFGGGLFFILVTRVVFGAGIGLSFMLYSTLIGDFFKGVEQQVMFGYAGALGGVAGMIYQALGGTLAGLFWRYSFYSTLLVLLPLILIYLKMPNPVIQRVASRGKQNDNAKKSSAVTPKTYILSVANLVYQTLQFSFMTNLALVIMDLKIGTPAAIGILFTVFSAGAMVAGAVYKYTYNLFGRLTLPFAIGCTLASFLILGFTSTLISYGIAAFAFGLGFGTYNPNFNFRILSSVGPEATSKASGLYWGFNGLGQFLSPLILFPIVTILGVQGGLRAPWYVVIAGLILFFVGWTLVCAKEEPAVLAPAAS